MTHTRVIPTVITVEVVGTNGADGDKVEFTMSINGQAVTNAEGKYSLDKGSAFETTWTYPGTTLSLSFSERQSAFVFAGEATTEITIPPEHTHLTVNGVETAINLPGLTTTLTVSSASNVIVNLPEVTTELTFTEETVAFTVPAYTMTSEKDCNGQSIDGAAADNLCVMGVTTTITLPFNAPASELYLYATGLTTAYTLPGMTTTIRSEKNQFPIFAVILELLSAPPLLFVQDGW